MAWPCDRLHCVSKFPSSSLPLCHFPRAIYELFRGHFVSERVLAGLCRDISALIASKPIDSRYQILRFVLCLLRSMALGVYFRKFYINAMVIEKMPIKWPVTIIIAMSGALRKPGTSMNCPCRCFTCLHADRHFCRIIHFLPRRLGPQILQTSRWPA